MKKETNDQNTTKPMAYDALLAPVTYGCPQCGSKNIKEECNNHHQNDDEMEYLEYMKCLDCGHGFVS